MNPTNQFDQRQNQPQEQYGPAVDPSTYGYAPNGPPQIPQPNPQQQGKVSAKSLNSTQNMLKIAEIRDGIVIMDDGSYRSIVMVKPINFDLMSGQERESVEYAYQGFLNSLYFPIQIFIHSERVDLNPYLQKLARMRQDQDNMLLGMLTEDYIAFMSELAQQTNIMDKRFYLIIPYFPTIDVQKAITQSKNFFTGVVGLFNTKQVHVIVNEADLEKAKDELKNRVQALLGALQQCGIQGLPLDTQELIELFYNTYNPDTATRQNLQNFDELNSAVVTKGEGYAPQPNLDRELPL